MSVLTRVAPNSVNGTVGTQSSTVLAQDNTRQFLVIQNTCAIGGNNMAITIDGSIPVINGNGIQLTPCAAFFADVCVPSGPVNIVGSASSTTYTILYG